MSEPDASGPEASLKALTRGRQSDPSIIFIETHYGDGRERKRKKGTKGPSSQMEAEPPDVEPGAHMVRYRVKVAGDYKLHVAYGNTTLEGSPFDLTVVPALLSVEHCTISGLCEQTGMLTAGKEVTGMVLLNDRCGNPVIPGPQVLGVPVKVTIDPIGPTLDPCGIEEQGAPQKIELCEMAKDLGGDLHVGAAFSFRLKVAGWYRIVCTVANTQLPLPHGCFPLLVTPNAKPDPVMCRVEDAPEIDEILPAGTRMGVLAVVRDRLGNVCAHGGHELRATVRAPNTALQAAHSVPYARGFLPNRGLIVWDRRDGTYEAIYTPQALGATTLSFSMASGSEIIQLGGRPLQFEVEAGLPSPAFCVAKGNGIRNGHAGRPTEFVVEARDAAGNLTDKRLELRIVLTPASSQQQLSVQAQGDGRHVVRYLVPVSGIYKLSIFVGENGSVRPVDRRHINQSPFTVPVHSGERAGASTARSMPQSPTNDSARGRPSEPLSARGVMGERELSPGSGIGRARSASPAPMPAMPRGHRGDASPRGGAASPRRGSDSPRRGETVRLGSPQGGRPRMSDHGSSPALSFHERTAAGTPNAQLFARRDDSPARPGLDRSRADQALAALGREALFEDLC